MPQHSGLIAYIMNITGPVITKTQGIHQCRTIAAACLLSHTVRSAVVGDPYRDHDLSRFRSGSTMSGEQRKQHGVYKMLIYIHITIAILVEHTSSSIHIL